LKLKQISISLNRTRKIKKHNEPGDFWLHSVQAMATDTLTGHSAAIFYKIIRKYHTALQTTVLLLLMLLLSLLLSRIC